MDILKLVIYGFLLTLLIACNSKNRVIKNNLETNQSVSWNNIKKRCKFINITDFDISFIYDSLSSDGGVKSIEKEYKKLNLEDYKQLGLNLINVSNDSLLNIHLVNYPMFFYSYNTIANSSKILTLLKTSMYGIELILYSYGENGERVDSIDSFCKVGGDMGVMWNKKVYTKDNLHYEQVEVVYKIDEQNNLQNIPKMDTTLKATILIDKLGKVRILKSEGKPIKR